MQAKVLLALTKIASRISNPSSLTSLYKSIEIGSDNVRCCSEFGNLELATDPTGLTNSVLLDCTAVSSVAGSLTKEAEITLKEDGNKIVWRSGRASGKLNLVYSDHKIPEITHSEFPWNPPDNFGNALLLASSACQAAAVSFGLYGITMETEGDNLNLISSNTIALACSKIQKGDFPMAKITVRPPVPGIIAALLGACPNCKMDVTAKGIFIEGDWLKAHLPLGTNLDHDLKEIAGRFTEQKQIAKIDSVAVKKFISRARALSEKNSSFTVKMRVDEGKLALEHAGLSSSTEEYFLAEGLDATLTLAPVTLPADMLMLPLQFVQHAIFDYLPKNNLVLRGADPDFTYVLSGGE